MKFKRIFAAVSAVIMSISMLSSFLVTAAETEEKIYTLNELLEMSDEEFLVLDENNSRLFETIKYKDEDTDMDWDIEPMITGKFDAVCTKEDNYVANITEKNLHYILDDSLTYKMNSPITDCVDFRYIPSLSIKFDDYYYTGKDVTDENVMIMAKCWYCINQVIKIQYVGNGIGELMEIKVISGDVNFDETVDLYDVIWITKHSAQIYEFPEGQKAVADVSGDGMVNVVDAIMLAKHVNSQEVV